MLASSPGRLPVFWRAQQRPRGVQRHPLIHLHPGGRRRSRRPPPPPHRPGRSRRTPGQPIIISHPPATGHARCDPEIVPAACNPASTASGSRPPPGRRAPPRSRALGAGPRRPGERLTRPTGDRLRRHPRQTANARATASASPATVASGTSAGSPSTRPTVSGSPSNAHHWKGTSAVRRASRGVAAHDSGLVGARLLLRHLLFRGLGSERRVPGAHHVVLDRDRVELVAVVALTVGARRVGVLKIADTSRADRDDAVAVEPNYVVRHVHADGAGDGDAGGVVGDVAARVARVCGRVGEQDAAVVDAGVALDDGVQADLVVDPRPGVARQQVLHVAGVEVLQVGPEAGAAVVVRPIAADLHTERVGDLRAAARPGAREAPSR